MTDDRTRRWFFVHMHKTAGTTLYYRLRDAFPGGAVYPTRDEQRAWKASLDVEVLLRQFVARQHELRIVTGHFPLCTTELLGVPFSTITVLREPVERTLSALRDMHRVVRAGRVFDPEALFEAVGWRRARRAPATPR